MFPVRDERWFLPFFPPPRFVRAPCSSAHLARLLSPFVLSASSPSVNVYSAAPLQCPVPPIVHPPSSVRRRATNPPAPADQCPLPVSRPSVPYAGLLPPPRPIRLVVLGLGVGVCGGAKGDGPLRCLESVVSSAGIPGLAARCMPPPDARLPSRFWQSAIDMSPSTRSVDARILSCVLRARLSVCPPHPPPPFPVQPYVSLYAPS